MSEYQLEIQQIVIYPRCRSYRQFIQNLMADRSICTSRGAGLFYYLFRIALINLKKTSSFIFAAYKLLSLSS